METSESKTLLQIKKEVAWKWNDAAGFQFEVKGLMKDQNSITFLQNGKRIILDRKIKANLSNGNNLIQQGTTTNVNTNQDTGIVQNNQIQLVDEELSKNINQNYQYPNQNIEQVDNNPVLPFGEINCPNEENNGVQIPSIFEPYVPKLP